MRIFTALMMPETNRYSPFPTNIDSFGESFCDLPRGGLDSGYTIG